MSTAVERQFAEQGRGSGGQGRAPEPRYLIVGQVRGAHGLQGELRVQILTDDPHRFELLGRVFLGMEETEPVPRLLTGYRPHSGWALLQFEGCNDRATAEALRGCLVQVPIDEAIPLEEGEFFEHQILGLEVWTVSGERLGSVVEILYTGANDVYVVRRNGPPPREILIPVIAGVVLQVDLEAGRLVVELPEGLV